MNLKEQLYVLTLAESGSITKAAEQLYITQPALSLYINNLEKSMGAKLFTKKSNKFILTYIGEKYVEKAKSMLKLQDEFNLELSLMVKGVVGRMRIGVQLRRSPYIVPEIAAFFKDNYPNIELIFQEDNIKNLEKMLDDNEVDLIISSITNRKSDLDYVHIYDDKFLIAINSLSKLRRKAKWGEGDEFQWIDLKDLESETFILPHKGQSLRDSCDLLLEEEEIIPKKIIEIRNIETIMKLISKGFGVGFNRESYINQMFHIENVTFLNVKQSKFPPELVIAYSKYNSKIPNFLYMISEIKNILLEQK